MDRRCPSRVCRDHSAVHSWAALRRWQQSRILQEQHDLSKRQAAIAERLQAPVVSVSIKTPEISVNSLSKPHYQAGVLEYFLSNHHGQAAVYLLAVEGRIDLIVVGHGLPPPFAPNDPSICPMSYVMVSPNGNSPTMTTNLTPLMMSERGDALYGNDRLLFLTIFVRVEDIFSDRWIIGQCYQFDDIASEWVQTGSRNHNYFLREVK
jgi:hypothetical protein